jgi:SAM-dependent methyltransferase
MPNPFDTDAMATGYATSRPPVHTLILEKAWPTLKRERPFRLALDIGCGAGLSTRALSGIAEHSIGLEPAESMLRWSGELVPQAEFVVGAAEALPVRTSSLDLIAAAGSLNYVDLDLFFPEAARALRSGGRLLVYDFSVGNRFRDSGALEQWHQEFLRRYPKPPREAKILSPDILGGLSSGFRIDTAEPVETGISLAPGFYVSYMMTESNVASALRNGAVAEEIRSWCAATLLPVWEERPREVLFRGYFAWMAAA